MRKIVYILGGLFCLSLSQSIAQDTLVVMKAGQAVYKRVVSEVDSIIFKPKKLTVTDIDGNIYLVVTVGTQVWMGENLRVEKYNDGTPIPLVIDNTSWANNRLNKTKLPMMTWYNNDKATYTANKYGALYNWHVVNTAKLCPVGWHVPTDAEWTIFTTYLGGATVAGIKLKATSGWDPGENSTNETKFSAFPGGYLNDLDGTFNAIGRSGYWWSATAVGTSSALKRQMFYNNSNVLNLLNWTREIGMSVRCIMD